MSKYAEIGGVRHRRPSKRFILPVGWKSVAGISEYHLVFRHLNGLQVIIGDEQINKVWWRHVSASRECKVPDYEEMVKVKEIFIGLEKAAYQVIPRRSEHYNLHPNCLHLFSAIDERDDPMPDFRKKGPDGNYYL